MRRTPCCGKGGLKKGPWTPEEDKKLIAYAKEHGHGNWHSLPARAGLQRCGKSCRLRWINYLKPDIKRGNFSLEEDRTIIQLHALLGNKWSIMAAHLPKRTDNEIKNYWNTHIKKRLMRMGIDPITHKPKANSIEAYGGGQSKDAVNVSHMAQWESVRLEAEARSSLLQVGSSGSTRPPRLFITKIQIPTRPSRSSDSLSTKKHNNALYNHMCAIMLATDDFQSPVSTLSFPSSGELPVSTNVGQFTQSSLLYDQGDSSNIIETSGQKIMDVYGSDMQDDNIMVAAEAFRAARRESGIPELLLNGDNATMEGLMNDSFERFGEELAWKWELQFGCHLSIPKTA